MEYLRSGLVNGLSAVSRKLGDAMLQIIRNVPHLALGPLVIIRSSIGRAKLCLVALGVFFPI